MLHVVVWDEKSALRDDHKDVKVITFGKKRKEKISKQKE